MICAVWVQTDYKAPFKKETLILEVSEPVNKDKVQQAAESKLRKKLILLAWTPRVFDWINILQ